MIYIFTYNYLQKLGCAIGNKLCKYLYGKVWKELYTFMSSSTLKNFYCWFIIYIYIFLPWNGSETQLLDFITRLNSGQPGTKFDFIYSKFNIELLDLKIYINKQKNNLLTAIYQRPTDGRNFFYHTSTQSKSLTNSIAFNQALGLKMICWET